MFSMTLHCAMTLGFIDYLYNERYEISMTLGLIEEVPIALCGSRYEAVKTFKNVNRENSRDNQKSLPGSTARLHSISLFVISDFCLDAFTAIQQRVMHPNCVANLYRFSHFHPVFHPPTAIA
jgi:hypothetical protein